MAAGRTTPASGTTDASAKPASDQQQQQIQQLQRADASVRQHEAAHQATGGPYAGGASFTYTRGPDGKNYATAGEVPVDTSPERDPQATIRKMETVKAAALAPADPSPQDLRVAQQADAAKAQAQQELRGASSGAGGGDAGKDTPGNPSPGNGTAAPALAARGAAAYGAASAIGRQPAYAGITV
ncbi:putative metalloprotease CJM1_0395 family protein [Azospirillum rugosum]|uniref:SprA-related family protein n=1 Tax=Azospirillum rugosum TaxID=416170 RepID=A0ABS4SVZ1_9PROT|nr:putative metalloprotease CJM1_0395 family protein [Azospirillum rugosum]MBP2296726.1 hypothetical protein [Azospirillum rugosum]MDQ0530461.1 hypothetical protein [Azospirillum rugosum]